MKTMKNKVFQLIAVSLFSGAAYAQSPDECCGSESHSELERAREIARQISGDIASRIYDRVTGNTLMTASLAQNPMAASADSGAYMPDGVWGTTSWTEISDDAGFAHNSSDMYKLTAGVDKRFGDFIVGLTTSYAYTETEFGSGASQGDVHTVDVTPYAAFILNENIFFAAHTSYAYTRTEPDFNFGNADFDTDEYKTEVTINGVKAIDNWFVKGRAGGRYRHTDIDLDSGSGFPFDNDQDEWTYLVDTEVGYVFSRGYRVYGGALYEYVETEDGEDDGVLYMSAGFDYSVSKDFALGIKYRTDVNNEDFNLHTVSLNMNLAL